MPKYSIDQVYAEALGVLGDYFSAPAKAKDADMRAQARTASSFIASYAMLVQGATSTAALRLARLRLLNEANPEVRKQLRSGR